MCSPEQEIAAATYTIWLQALLSIAFFPFIFFFFFFVKCHWENSWRRRLRRRRQGNNILITNYDLSWLVSDDLHKNFMRFIFWLFITFANACELVQHRDFLLLFMELLEMEWLAGVFLFRFSCRIGKTILRKTNFLTKIVSFFFIETQTQLTVGMLRRDHFECGLWTFIWWYQHTCSVFGCLNMNIEICNTFSFNI